MKVFQGRARLLGVVLMFAMCGAGPVSKTAHAQASQQAPSPDVSEKSTPINAVPEKREQEKDENEAFRHSAMVQKMGHMVGLDAEQAATAFTILNFLILAIGVGYLAAKMLPKAFRDRNSAIQKHLVEARTATEEAGARLKAVEARLGRLDDEIAQMRRQAELDANREDERVRASMEQETAKILAAAEAEIQASSAAARRDLQRHAAELAIDHAARRLEISAETDRLLIEGFAQRLTGDKGGQN